eukprot:symbB.v1.2.036720.t1/scaffold5248.1/size29375/1
MLVRTVRTVLCYVHLLFLLTSSSWSSVVGEGAKPAGRSRHTMVLEAPRRFWLFGGSGSTSLSLRFSDLWMFDLELQVWFQLEQSQLNETPTAREDHVAVWDPGGSALWVHGGYDGANFLQDLWHYSTGSWTLQSQNGPTRSGHIAVWNEFSLLIHGGFDGNGLHSDTWKFDSHSLSWTQIFSVNEETADPSPRAQHVGVWDAGILWIHGGFDGSSFCDDLWQFHLGTSLWIRIGTGSSATDSDVPPRRGYHAAAWDDVSAALWIHGGIDAHEVRGDLWRFDSRTNLWSFMGDSTVEAPFGRYNHVAAWDVKSKMLWIHGGQSAQAALGALGDFWNSNVLSTTVTSSLTSTVMTVSSTHTSTATFTDTSTVTRTSTQSATTSARPGATGIDVGISPVSLSILVVALLGGMALLAFLLGGRCGGVDCVLKPKSVVMPMKQQNEAILGPEPVVSSPLPSPAIPWCMEVTDLPELHFEEWLLRIPMDDDGDCDDHEDPFHLGRCCSERSLGSEETRQQLQVSILLESSGCSKHPSVSQVLKDTGASIGSSSWKDRKDLNAVGFVDQLPSVPPSPDHAAFSSPAPVMKNIHPADSCVKCLLPVTECPSIDLPGLNLPGPCRISELVPIHWPHLVSQLFPSFSAAPLSLPPPRRCGDDGNITQNRRPTVPLPVQLPEILLEPATNPMPPKRSKTNRKAWKRPKSTKLGLFTEDLCVCPLEGEGVLISCGSLWLHQMDPT